MSNLRENNANGVPALAMKLAAPQQFLLDAFEQVGLTVEAVGETLLDVMRDPESDHRVDAARLFLDATIGRAPNTSMQKNLHVHAKMDKFFDADAFSNAPSPKLPGDS